jgi:hypothetical protein
MPVTVRECSDEDLSTGADTNSRRATYVDHAPQARNRPRAGVRMTTLDSSCGGHTASTRLLRERNETLRVRGKAAYFVE